MFVMDTYGTKENKVLSHKMLVFHVVVSVAVVVSAIAGTTYYLEVVQVRSHGSVAYAAY